MTQTRYTLILFLVVLAVFPIAISYGFMDKLRLALEGYAAVFGFVAICGFGYNIMEYNFEKAALWGIAAGLVS